MLTANSVEFSEIKLTEEFLAQVTIPGSHEGRESMPSCVMYEDKDGILRRGYIYCPLDGPPKEGEQLRIRRDFHGSLSQVVEKPSPVVEKPVEHGFRKNALVVGLRMADSVFIKGPESPVWEEFAIRPDKSTIEPKFGPSFIIISRL